MELPGVKIVGKITLPPSDKELKAGYDALCILPLEDELTDEQEEEIHQEWVRRHVWLQDMYAKGYTYEDLFGNYSDLDY